jgi:transcriptional regulator with XRE-family HTH domain
MFDSLPRIVTATRKASGLSRSALAKLAGISQMTLFHFEHGRKTIQLDTLSKILSVLNIRVAFTPPSVVQDVLHESEAAELKSRREESESIPK